MYDVFGLLAAGAAVVMPEADEKREPALIPGSQRLTAVEAMADLYQTLPPDAAETWEKDSRTKGNLSEEMRDPWDS